MNDKPIDKLVKEYYQRKTLSPESMARMLAVTDRAEKNKQKVSFWRQRWFLQRNLSLAASLIIAVLLIPLLWENESYLLADVAQEVALNHNKQIASEYVDDNYQSLANMMTKLDFELSFPTRLYDMGYQVIGARYCSIQGEIAAQIKLLNNEGDLVTLYQTRLNDELVLLNEQSYTADNVAVHNWQEENSFFSLARTVIAD